LSQVVRQRGHAQLLYFFTPLLCLLNVAPEILTGGEIAIQTKRSSSYEHR
jgi:hypothetical protein